VAIIEQLSAATQMLPPSTHVILRPQQWTKMGAAAASQL